MPFDSTAQHQMQLIDAMSHSLMFSLARWYLDVPFENANYIQALRPIPGPVGEACFMQLKQIGASEGLAPEQPLTALRTILSACHTPDQFTIIFLVASDGRETRIYLGARSHDLLRYDAKDFLHNISLFLRGNWPGTQLEMCDAEGPDFQRFVAQPVQTQFHSTMAMTGIPSLKVDSRDGYPQSLDRLLHGLQGVPYSYMVIARPLAHGDVRGIVHRLRDMTGRVQSVARVTLNDTQSLATSRSASLQTSQSTSEQSTHTTSTRSSRSQQVDRSSEIYLGAAMLAGLFPPAGLLALLAAETASFLSTPYTTTEEQTDSHQTTRSQSSTETLSETMGETSTVSRNLVRDYVNQHAQAAKDMLEQNILRFDRTGAAGCWDVGVYLLSPRPDLADRSAMQFRALLTGRNHLEPIRVHDLKRVRNDVKKALAEFDQPNLALVRPDTRQRVVHPLGDWFSNVTTILNTEELALLVNLPRREVPGIPVVATADFSLNPPQLSGTSRTVTLGHVVDGGETTNIPMEIPLDLLSKHTLITGITGSGKSTTCRQLLTQAGQHVPFLIIEAAKTEYVDWVIAYNRAYPQRAPIRVFIPGYSQPLWRGEPIDPHIQLNPFDIIELDQVDPGAVLAHIDRIKAILNAAFPMPDALPIYLENVLYAAYKARGWLDDPPPARGAARPTVTEIINQHIEAVIAAIGYDDRFTKNLTSVLRTRFEHLRRGWRAKFFDQPTSTDWSALFDQPAVINLSYLGDDTDKAFAMAVLFQFLYEYRQAKYHASEPTGLSHLTIIEEAHRILRHVPAGSSEQANPQAKMGEAFSNMISEMRAYGEGLVIVDQAPGKLISDAIKNTNLKIVHRLVHREDYEAMADSMALATDQMAIIPRLWTGQAIAFGDRDSKAYMVQIRARNTPAET